MAQSLQCWSDADGDSVFRRCRRPQYVPEVLTQSLSVTALEVDTMQHPVTSWSAISDAIVNAEALADIADCDFVAMSSADVAVAMETFPPTSAAICISDPYAVSTYS